MLVDYSERAVLPLVPLQGKSWSGMDRSSPLFPLVEMKEMKLHGVCPSLNQNPQSSGFIGFTISLINIVA